jgi:hypothetical protein
LMETNKAFTDLAMLKTIKTVHIHGAFGPLTLPKWELLFASQRPDPLPVITTVIREGSRIPSIVHSAVNRWIVHPEHYRVASPTLLPEALITNVISLLAKIDALYWQDDGWPVCAKRKPSRPLPPRVRDDHCSSRASTLDRAPVSLIEFEAWRRDRSHRTRRGHLYNQQVYIEIYGLGYPRDANTLGGGPGVTEASSVQVEERLNADLRDTVLTQLGRLWEGRVTLHCLDEVPV